jgi:SgrR family transcriptional regulator
MNPATWSQQLLAKQTVVPLIHHWLMIQGSAVCAACG